MAKKKLNLANYGYIFLTIMAMQFIGLVGIIVAQCGMGKLSSEDLIDMLFVLKGTHKYVQSESEYRDYQKYLAARDEYWKKLDISEGAPATRRTAAEAVRKQRELQREEAAALQQLLQKEKQDLEVIRDSITREKKKLGELQQVLKDREKRTALKDLDAKRRKLVKVLSSMDAGLLGKYFSSILRNDPVNGPVESARLMHSYLKGTLIAEIMEEMPEEDQQKILPVLEHKYAAWQPEKIAREWSGKKMLPEIMAEYLKQMSATKAFRVISYLDAHDRAKVVQILQSQNQ